MFSRAFGLSLTIGAAGAVALAVVANAAALPIWAVYIAFVLVVAISVTPLGLKLGAAERRTRR